MLKKIAVAFFLLGCTQLLFADAMPKGYQKYTFNIKAKVDSIMIQESDNMAFSTYDTLKSRWHYKYIPCDENECDYVGSYYKKYQRLILFSGNRQIILPVYQPTGSNPTFLITQQNGTYHVTETTGFLFRGVTGQILRALLITLILELLVALTLLGGHISKRNFKFIALANCISLPTAWLSFDVVVPLIGGSFTLILVFEVLIVLFEFAFLRYFLRDIPPLKLLKYCFVANCFSFILGGILYIITTFF